MSGVEYTCIRPVKTPGPDGRAIDAVIARTRGISSQREGYRLLRVSDGTSLGIIADVKGYSAGPSVMKDLLITTGDSRRRATAAAFRWGWDTNQTLVTSRQYTIAGGLAPPDTRILTRRGRPPTLAASPFCMFNGAATDVPLFDPATGRRLGHIAMNSGQAAIIAGHYAIIPQDQPGTSYSPRGRIDAWATRNYVIADISNPMKPVIVSDRNLLVLEHGPKDLAFDRHLAPHGISKTLCWFDDEGERIVGRPMGGAEGYLHANFGGTRSQLMPHGNMLFIQSAGHLYGIGAD